MWDASANAVENFTAGETAAFSDFWYSNYYSIGQWNVENLVGIYDKELNLITGEHHSTTADGREELISFPEILTGAEEDSMGYLENLANDEQPTDIIFSKNKHPILIKLGEITHEDNDTAVGYIIIGKDLFSIIDNLIKGILHSYAKLLYYVNLFYFQCYYILM